MKNSKYLSFQHDPDPARTSLDRILSLVKRIVNTYSKGSHGTYKTSGMTFRRIKMRDGRIRTDIMKRVYIKSEDQMGVKPILSCVLDPRNGIRKVADYEESWIHNHIQWIEEIADHGTLQI